MTMTPQEYERALAHLREKLASPKKEREEWLNGIVDSWITRRRGSRLAVRARDRVRRSLRSLLASRRAGACNAPQGRRCLGQVSRDSP